LIVFVALVSVMKTIFISVNNVMARRYNVSYSSVAALTAVPLIVSAFSGLASVTAAKVWGKRPVYLVSMALVFIGSMWNMRTLDSYRQCMAARVFQGLGWGAFDTLVLGSIYDTFFVSRCLQRRGGKQ
jgi:MFS family permease